MAEFTHILDALLGVMTIEVVPEVGDPVTLERRTKLRLIGDFVTAVDNDIEETTDITIGDPGTHGYKQPVRAVFLTNLTVDAEVHAATVGSTLTGDVDGALSDADGIALDVGDRVALISQTDEAQNGIYDVEDLGSGSSKFVLRRSVDAREEDQLQVGHAFKVQEGSTKELREYLVAQTGQVDTDAIVFSLTGSGGGVTAPADPGDDGKLALADGGDLTWLAGTDAGNVPRWQGTAWASNTLDATDPNSIDDGGTGKVLQGTGSGNDWVDDLIVNGDLGATWGRTHTRLDQSTDATATRRTIFTAANGLFLVIAVVAAQEPATGAARIWELKRKFSVVGGVVTAVSASIEVSNDGINGSGSSAAWTASITNTGTAIEVLETGEAAKTINWRIVGERINYLT